MTLFFGSFFTFTSEWMQKYNFKRYSFIYIETYSGSIGVLYQNRLKLIRRNSDMIKKRRFSQIHANLIYNKRIICVNPRESAF